MATRFLGNLLTLLLLTLLFVNTIITRVVKEK